MSDLAAQVLRVARGALAPSSLRPARVGCALAFVAVTVLAWAGERPLQLEIEGRGGRIASAVATFANLAGSGYAVAALGVVALAAGTLLRKEDLTQAALVLGAAGLWAFLLVQVGQLVLAEQRPIEGGAMRFLALHGHGVSGHAAAAAVLILPVRDVWLCRASSRSRHLAFALLILWAAVVGWSRVWLGMHFAWNVVLGFAVGFWASSDAVAAWRERT
jgi:membrane-associated phospholipid phosphatase